MDLLWSMRSSCAKKPVICRVNGMRVAEVRKSEPRATSTIASDLVFSARLVPRHGSAPWEALPTFFPV